MLGAMPTRTALAVALATAVVASPALCQKRTVYVKDLEALFKEVQANYPFFDVKGISKDWRARKKALGKRARSCKSDADFIAIATDALKGLRDGHCRFTEVRPKLKKPEPAYWPGLVFLPASKDRVVIAATVTELENRLPRGTVIEKIDGKKARAFLDARGQQAWQYGGFFSRPQRARFFEYRLPLAGDRGAKHVLDVRTGRKKRKVTVRSQHAVKGWLHLYNPPAGLQQSAKSVWHVELEGPTGYVWLRRMDSTAEDGVRKAIEAHQGVRGWIVDLRGNSGGGYDRSFKTLIANLGRRVAVIIDAGAVSAAETFSRDLVNVCKARVFGARTAGSSSSKKVWRFPSGIAAIRYSVRSRSGVGGKPIEFHGIQPDVEIEADPEDVAAGRNTEIVTALAWLQKSLRNSKKK
jgi:hypothetical protein